MHVRLVTELPQVAGDTSIEPSPVPIRLGPDPRCLTDPDARNQVGTFGHEAGAKAGAAERLVKKRIATVRAGARIGKDAPRLRAVRQRSNDTLVDFHVVLNENERLPRRPQPLQQRPIGRGGLAEGDELGLRLKPLDGLSGQRMDLWLKRADR